MHTPDPTTHPPKLPHIQNVCTTTLYNPTCTDSHLHTLYSTVTHKTRIHWPTCRILLSGWLRLQMSITFASFCPLTSTVTILCGTHSEVNTVSIASFNHSYRNKWDELRLLTSLHGPAYSNDNLDLFTLKWGSGIAQWLERQTRDWKVAGSNPCRSGGRIFFSRVNFLWWLLFRYPLHLRVTAVAHKRSRSFCEKCRWQVTAKHTGTLHMWLCMKWHGAWLYGVHRTRRDGSSFLWHQPCQRCKYTTFGGYSKTRYKKLTTHIESHASAVSLLESGE